MPDPTNTPMKHNIPLSTNYLICNTKLFQNTHLQNHINNLIKKNKTSKRQSILMAAMNIIGSSYIQINAKNKKNSRLIYFSAALVHYSVIYFLCIIISFIPWRMCNNIIMRARWPCVFRHLAVA